MMTIIGTGHVFNISEPIMFIVKHIWPDCVLVELDTKRAGQAKDVGPDDSEEDLWLYRHTVKYQAKMAKKQKTRVGNELLTAAQMGRLLEAEVGFIDVDARKYMNRAWAEMSAMEKFRYKLSTIRDAIGGEKEARHSVEEYSANEEKTMAVMRKKYPTLMRVLIDERNEYMAEQIRGYVGRYKEIVVVVGDAHVEGIASILNDPELRKIRLTDVINKEKLDKIRAEVWNRKREDDES